MVSARALPRLLAAAFAICFVAGCGDDDGPLEPDLAVSWFIECDIDMGSMTNPGCPSTLPMCHPFAHICVGCIPSMQTCQPGFECSQSSYTCMPLDPNRRCTRNVDCPLRVDGGDPKAIICEVDAGVCLECVSDSDCVGLDGRVGLCIRRTHKCGDDVCENCLPTQTCDRINQRCL